MKQLLSTICFVSFGLILTSTTNGQQNLSETQLQKLLNQFPGADANGDGVLSNDEFLAARANLERNEIAMGGEASNVTSKPTPAGTWSAFPMTRFATSRLKKSKRSLPRSKPENSPWLHRFQNLKTEHCVLSELATAL